MAPESGEPEATISGVYVDDFKKLEASMGAQMEELRAMMAQLLNANMPPAAPSLEANASAAQSGDGEKPIKDPRPKIDGGKAEHHEVPFVYSPDPPIPHPHINNRGDPPRLNPSCFSN